MDAMNGPGEASENANATALESGYDAENVPPWELVDTGRYRPRRIRGSCRGRELG